MSLEDLLYVLLRMWGKEGSEENIRRMRPMGMVTGAAVDWPGAGVHSTWAGLTDRFPGSLLWEAWTCGRLLIPVALGRDDDLTRVIQKKSRVVIALSTVSHQFQFVR